MTIFWAIILGAIQGLTEFLPVSSSGHLVLVQKLIPNFNQPGIVFDVLVHMGTLLAVFLYFRKKIFSLSRHYLGLLFVGSLPAVVLGFVFKDFFENTFLLGGILLALQFLVTSILCYLTDLKKGKRSRLDFKNSFLIGIAQAISILPAISRSGATIFAGTFLGVERKEAAEYSFLLSMPAILGASTLELISYKNQIFPLPPSYLIGFLVALITGVFSIHLTISLLEKKEFKIFAFYTALVAIFALFKTT